MQEKNYCVYKHTSPSGKVYIGITCQEPKKRWKNGCAYKSNQHFTNAIEKYGWGNFTHEILFTNLTKEEACQKEIELIAFYKSNQSEFGYNRSSGGESGRNGCYWSIEDRKRLSEIHKNISDETREKMSKSHKGQIPWNKGVPQTKEQKQKNSEVHKGKKHTEESKKKLSNSLKGHPTSLETREKISQANKGKKRTEEQRRAMSKRQKGKPSPMKGKKLSDEDRINISERTRAAMTNKEIRKKISEHNATPKVAIAYKEYKSNGGTLTWNEFQKEYSKQIA